MKIGVSTACFYPLETELSLEQIGKSGVKLAEVFFNAECELESSFINRLIEIQKEYGISVVSVHPFMALAEPFMLFSNYSRRFKAGCEDYKRYSEVAARLGANYIVMHGGKDNGLLSPQEYCERYMILQEIANKNGVTVLQENVSQFRAGGSGFLKAIKDILGDKAQFCFDIKQSIRRGYDPFEIIDLLGSGIKHFHISDHLPERDCLLPGRGIFDFDRFFGKTAQMGYKGSYIIEVYNNAYKSYSEIFDSYQQFMQNFA